jgi:hypothetical protein
VWWGDWRTEAPGVWRVVGGPWDGFVVADGEVATRRWVAVADVVVYSAKRDRTRSGTGSPALV